MSSWAEPRVRAALARPSLDLAHVVFASLAFFVAFGANGIKNAFGWWTWGALVLIVFGVSLGWLIRSGAIRRVADLPRPLAAFWLLTALSLIWSQWRPETLLGVTITTITLISSWAIGALMSIEEIIVALSRAVRAVVALSFAFELWVSIVVRHPVLPVWLSGDPETADLQTLWSRDLLFVSGKIQGIVGNSAILAQIAGVALVALVVQYLIGRIGRLAAIIWLALIVLTLVLTASATMTVAIAITAVVAIAVLVRRRIVRFGARAGYGLVVLAVVIVAVVLATTRTDAIIHLLGKQDDLTGRTSIWANTIGLAVEHPWFGWGWLGYWPPWLAPLNTLNIRYGVPQLHAHDAWVDLFLQLGMLGVVVFAALVLWALWGSYRAATASARGELPPIDDAMLLPVLLIVLLVVQTVTESGILVQEGLFLFGTMCVVLSRAAPRREPAA
ncbi:O-antigen ligase family protein [Galbitalea sp. SE-J8]|uniref:O-antigen ligase family protein n=1 Tax=Galbitalea sp. SE-J8 TaxID=3054952 RepID=UPI00259D24C9|nr:O-antigen ligase family protein [Galbitalea sp. SE-J8]MDM4762723.1 O-antigen ligase family protein [Galbitalea sp. SE-J8]